MLANRRFLAERRLAAFFVADEPLFNVEVSSDHVSFYTFRKRGGVTRRYGETINLDECLSCFDALVENLMVAPGVSDDAVGTILDEVEEDLHKGALRPFLRAPSLSGP
jgi:hypothetical protein